MDTDNTYPTPSDILENKEKNSLLYIALDKNVTIRTKRRYAYHNEGILKKIQGNFVLLEKEEKKRLYKQLFLLKIYQLLKLFQ